MVKQNLDLKEYLLKTTKKRFHITELKEFGNKKQLQISLNELEQEKIVEFDRKSNWIYIDENIYIGNSRAETTKSIIFQLLFATLCLIVFSVLINSSITSMFVELFQFTIFVISMCVYIYNFSRLLQVRKDQEQIMAAGSVGLIFTNVN